MNKEKKTDDTKPKQNNNSPPACIDSQIKTKSPENKLNHKKENIFVAFNLNL